MPGNVIRKVNQLLIIQHCSQKNLFQNYLLMPSKNRKALGMLLKMPRESIGSQDQIIEIILSLLHIKILRILKTNPYHINIINVQCQAATQMRPK